MQRTPKTGWTIHLWWLLPLLLLLSLRLLPRLTWFGLGFVLLLAAGTAWLLRRGARDGGQDEFAEEEAARKSRLAELEHQAEQMRITLRDLRSLRLDAPEATRAQWAEIELEESLQQTCAAMARERGALLLLEATRWLAQIEPLLRRLDRLDQAAVNHWLGRIEVIRSRGVDLLQRSRADAEAAELDAGASAIRLLEDALGELTALRADLVTRRAELLTRTRPHELQEADPEPSLQRLRSIVSETRARREVNSWMAE